MIVAIDYDGTITDDDSGDIREECFYYIPILYDMGCILVLWTARDYQCYCEATNKLEESGLLKYFTPLKECDIGYCGKVVADVYLDDRCYFSFDWNKAFMFINNILKGGDGI